VNSGILLVDKPQGITSHDVVSRMRRLAGTRKIGHAGTLDPMATGLLLLGVGSSTRLLHHLVGLDKQYLATIRLGWGTTSDDAEGEPLGAAPHDAVAGVGDAAIAAEIAALTGVIEQVPSAVSAVKIDGKRAYQRVREGEQVEIPARTVTIAAFELLETRRSEASIDLDVRVDCSSGTYIRALARDLGAALGVGGHLTALRRTRIGGFSVDEAGALDDYDVAARLIAPAAAARRALPALEVDEAQAVDLGHGKRIAVPEGVEWAKGRPAAAILPRRGSAPERLVAIVERRGGQFQVVAGFPQEQEAPR
jgi:tRNA pseudouridine55 synthase